MNSQNTTTWADLRAKYAKPAATNSSGGSMTWDDLKAKYQNKTVGSMLSPQTTTDTKPKATMADYLKGAIGVQSPIDLTPAVVATGKFLTSSERGLGEYIASGVGGMFGAKSVEQQNKALSDTDLNNVKTIIGLKNKAKSAGQDTSHYDTLLKNYQFTGGQKLEDVYPALKKSGLDLGIDIVGTAADVLSAGTYGAATAEMKAGELAAKKAAPTLIEKPIEAVSEKMAANKAAKITEMVSPRLSASEAEKVGATTPKGFLGKISAVVTDRTKQVYQAVKDIVDPAKTFTENANKVEKAIGDEATKLKSAIKASDHPYTFKELQSTLKSIDIPEFIKTGEKTVQDKAGRIIDKFMEIAKSKDGTVSSLLDARKEFDIWIKKEYPKVFDEGGNAIQSLVKNVRTAANDFIAKNVPEAGVKESLKLQNLMYDAADNLWEKMARGAPTSAGEIGTNRFGRFFAKHPIIKKAAQAIGIGAAGAIGAGGVYEGGKDILGQ
jgi:hypothetical protein